MYRRLLTTFGVLVSLSMWADNAAAVGSGAAPQKSADIRSWLVGRWADNGDCSFVTQLFQNGTYVQPNGSTGAWAVSGRSLIIGTLVLKIEEAHAKSLVLSSNGKKGTSTRCPHAQSTAAARQGIAQLLKFGTVGSRFGGSPGQTFVNVKIGSVSVSLPTTWRLVEGFEESLIQQIAGEATPSGLEHTESTVLLAATSMPTSTYASTRFTQSAPSFSPSDLPKIAKADLTLVFKRIRTELAGSLAPLGIEILSFYGSKFETVSGRPAILTRYRRSGLKGAVVVEYYTVFTPKRDIDLWLSYRESETARWKPVMDRIRSSLVIAD